MTQARLHVADPLQAGATVRLEDERAHYLRNVLRLREGDPVRLFNARDGEWAARLAGVARHAAILEPSHRVRSPAAEPGPTLVFAPIRRNRLDWLAEKAVELGVSRLVPLLTERTVVRLENPARLRAIVAEAAEQCGRLTVPELAEPVPLGTWFAGVAAAAGPPVLLADEAGGVPVATALAEAAEPPDLLAGPEGGWAPAERALLLSLSRLRAVTLGPRTLRAETAALALLAAWQAIRGERPRTG